MNKISRVYIITECPYTGILRSIVELSSELKKNGFEVNYILPDKPRNRYGEIQCENEKILLKYGEILYTPLRRKLFYIFGDIKALKNLFLSRPPGIVVSYTEYAGKVCRILYSQGGIKKLYHCPNCVGVKRKRYLARFIEFIFENLLAKHASLYLACGPSEAFIFNDKYKIPIDKIIFLPNFRTFKNIKNNEHMYEFIYVGRMVRDKGVIELLEALTLLNLSDKVIFVGDGKLLPYLRSAYPKVKFTGNVSPEKVFYFLSISKFFVSNSVVEGLPYSLIEAMSTGVVPIVSNVEGHKDLIINGQNGIIYNKKIDLINSIFKAQIMDDKSYKEMRMSARETVENLAKLAKFNIKNNFK